MQYQTRPASPHAPGALLPQQCPQFVALSFDDNGYSGLPESSYPGAMSWFLDLFSSRKNHNGSSILATFLLKTQCLEDNPPAGFESPETVRLIHQKALSLGHEIASHTRTHPHGVSINWASHQRRKNLDHASWLAELDASLATIQRYLPESPRPLGFRTPYLEYNQDTFSALEARGMLYDSSIEAGWMPPYNGSTGVWPYTLHQGSPDEAWMSRHVFNQEPLIGTHPGLWEVPVSVITIPDDDACRHYGVEPGLRSRIVPSESYTQADQGRALGVDWNFWFEYGLSHLEVAAILCHNLDLRLAGNRAPLVFVGHTDIYSELYDRHLDAATLSRSKASPHERFEAWRIFVDYAITKPQVRIAPLADILAWTKNPQAL